MTRKITRPRSAATAATLAAFAAALSAGCGSDDAARPSEGATSTTTVVTSPEGGTTAATTTTATDAEGSATSASLPDQAAGGVPARTDNTNAGSGGATGTEQELADRINAKIIRNTQMTGSRVNVVVDAAGVATLTGFTQNQQQKALAVKAARETSGVTLVKNKLAVNPTGGAKPAPVATPAPAPVVTFSDEGGRVGGSIPEAVAAPRPQRPAASASPRPGSATAGGTESLLPYRPDGSGGRVRVPGEGASPSQLTTPTPEYPSTDTAGISTDGGG